MPRKPKTPDDSEEYSLYGGEVRLFFKESSHRTTVVDGGQTIKPGSVTTILGTLEKHGLVEWGVRCCADYVDNGLNDLLKGSSFSIESLKKLVTEARTAHERTRQEAADIGTQAHDWLAAHWTAIVQKTDGPPMPNEGPVKNCVDAALKWIAEHDIRPIQIERPFYSRKHKFTGKEDLAALVDGRLSIIDYKSSPKLWPEVQIQTAAYAAMYQEEFGIPVLDRWAVRLGKFDGEFETKKFLPETYEKNFRTFLAILQTYEDMKELRRKPKKPDWLDLESE